MILVRADGNGAIGSGHIMRCLSIASCLQALGHGCLFAVSDEESKCKVEEHGARAVILGGDVFHLGVDDGIALSRLAQENGVRSILVDSYAVTSEFFEAIASLSAGTRTSYLDDEYCFSSGHLDSPRSWGADRVVNYSFDADDDSYRADAFEGVDIHTGPAFAPIRPTFARMTYLVRPTVERILVTSGATNPGHALERMVEGCLTACPHAVVDVVVGGASEFASRAPGKVSLLTGVTDMQDLMCKADLVVSSSGTTLYELCAVGVPTVALPVVSNQLSNVRGFERLNLGKTLKKLDFTARDIASMVEMFASDEGERRRCSSRMLKTVDGQGAMRIAELLVGD